MWRVEIQGLVCLLYVAAGTDFPDRVPELTLQVCLLSTPGEGRVLKWRQVANYSVILRGAICGSDDTA